MPKRTKKTVSEKEENLEPNYDHLAEQIDARREKEALLKKHYPQKKGYVYVPPAKCQSGCRFGYFRKLQKWETPTK